MKIIFLDFNGTIDKSFTYAKHGAGIGGEFQQDFLPELDQTEPALIEDLPAIAVADHVDSCETCWDEGGRYGQCHGCSIEYHTITPKTCVPDIPEPEGPSPVELGETPESELDYQKTLDALFKDQTLGHPYVPAVTRDKEPDQLGVCEAELLVYAPELPGMFRAHDYPKEEPTPTKWGRQNRSSWVSTWGHQDYRDEPNPDSVKYIKQLADKTGAKIVYSTTLRFGGWKSCADYLGLNYSYSLGHPFYGVTPNVSLFDKPKKKFSITWFKNIPLFKKQAPSPMAWGKPRQQEIKKWLSEWERSGGEKIESYVILDDDSITDPELAKHWIPSISQNRFLKDEYEQALKILKNKD